MKYYFFALFITFAFIFSGCPARSLNPLFTEQEVIYNPAMIGTWVNVDVSITFTKSSDKNYRAVYADLKTKDSLVYIVQLGKIGETWFLDSYPAENSQDDHMVAAHMISKIWFEKNQLYISTLESDWLKKMIDGKRLKIPHVRRKHEIILTASTVTLQQLVSKFGDNKEAFPTDGTPFIKK